MKINISDDIEILVFTGPESSGKTTCASRIAEEYTLPLVDEYAREYLNEHGPEYIFSDIQKIAALQINAETKAHTNNPLIICDTDIITLDIWALEKFDCSLDHLDEQVGKKQYFLCYPDIPWEPDPLRENPEDRVRLFKRYEEYLETQKIPFIILTEKDRKELELVI